MSRTRYRAFVVTLLAAGAALAMSTPAAHAVPVSGTASQAGAATNAAGCSVRFDQWLTGYVAYVTITGPAASWSIPFTLPGGHRLTQAWNVSVTVSGQHGTASNTSWNGNLGPGQSTGFGLVVTRPSGDTQLPTFPTCAVSS